MNNTTYTEFRHSSSGSDYIESRKNRATIDSMGDASVVNFRFIATTRMFSDQSSILYGERPLSESELLLNN